MYQFNYHKPSDLAEAVALFRDADDPMYLSGGMTLLATMKQRLAAPTDLIDLSGITEMTGITLLDGMVRVGAFTTHNTVAESAEIGQKLPVLAQLAAQIGDNQVRNRGTPKSAVSAAMNFFRICLRPRCSRVRSLPTSTSRYRREPPIESSPIPHPVMQWWVCSSQTSAVRCGWVSPAPDRAPSEPVALKKF